VEAKFSSSSIMANGPTSLLHNGYRIIPESKAAGA